MEIKDESLRSFAKLYERDFGVTLSSSEAHEKATLLMQYVMLFIKPVAENGEDDITEGPNASE